MTSLMELADHLGGQGSPVSGRTQARVLRALAHQLGAGVRRDLAHTLDVSAGTVSKAVAQLKKLRLVQEEPTPARGPGRPVTTLRWTRNYAMIGVTIIDRIMKWPLETAPGTLIGTVIGPDGTPFPGIETIRQRVELSDAARTDPRTFVEELETYIRELSAIPLHSEAQILGCGVTVGRDVDNGKVRQFHHTPLDGWTPHANRDLRRELEERLGISVALDNDITSLAVRASLRPDPDEVQAKHYLVLAVLNNGVGGALVLDGKVRRGINGMTAEPGHLPVQHVIAVHLQCDRSTPEQATFHIGEDLAKIGPDLDIPLCRCGHYGHVVAFAAPRAIIERAKLKGLTHERLDKIDELAARPRAEVELGDLFLQGGAALGRTIGAAINWINPERVAIYLPAALYEDNKYLTGSFYLAGLDHEVEMSTFSMGQTRLCCIVTSDVEMEDRLAAAAAYLVFERLADETENAERKHRVGEFDYDGGLTPTRQRSGKFELISDTLHQHHDTLPTSINFKH
jgi:predicted NBD/HSP70 family sugar kinase